MIPTTEETLRIMVNDLRREAEQERMCREQTFRQSQSRGDKLQVAEEALAASQQRCAELEGVLKVANATWRTAHDWWRAEQQAHAETQADRDELRVECARLREALLLERQRSSSDAYVEANAQSIPVENG